MPLLPGIAHCALVSADRATETARMGALAQLSVHLCNIYIYNKEKDLFRPLAYQTRHLRDAG